ncbi:DUF4270 family protein [Mucilaginibacter phyllosphaerae]|uniref:DUF4270 family protein n=1 Tax=Mucilaginibacter phyllosphaerae TaxID=1812349 RepID=A0A4Y8ADC4_9SPHI|nr:DUF4270 family protein [Mucilaginibacter phyllosphaerae]MBB3970228.1 hypothetical protein [Mucilaginibacter phyllosphaerae]TEW66608.1 DUF4270 family protein [Mucilaginibacter phyllosphaerae]GGH10639.1 hypothetical protein GCM10007352_16550 [Mucilaginibacter phyllosphaerae]
MKFNKLGLLTLLISLFILDSCKTQDSIGLDVDPATRINGTLIQDTSVVTTTVREDSIITNNFNTRAPLAYFKDPDLGTTEANIAAVLRLPGGTAYTLPTGTVTIDSVRLVLPYAAGVSFYGDSLLSSYKIDVHQLNERIVTTKAYANTYHFASKPELLGTKTFFARSHDSVTIANIRTGKVDTIQKVPPQLRIPISNSFINTNLFSASSSTLSSSTIFENTVNGLYFTLDKNQTPGTGGNLFFNLDSASVKVYYKRVDGTTIDTAIASLPFGVNVNEFKHTYSDKVKASLDGTSTDGLVYLQGLAGLRAKLSFPDIKNLFTSLDNKVVLNRAELVVKIKPGTATPFAPAKRLTLYKYNIAGQRVTIQDASSSDARANSVFGGNYNPTTGEYHFIITAFLQDLITGKTVDYGTYLAPVDPTGTAIVVTPEANYADRSMIGGKNSAYRVKINIIYTKLTQ